MKKYLFLLVALFVIVSVLFGKSALFRFLAITQRVDTDVLIIEGWTDSEGLKKAAAEIDAFSYRRVIVASLTYPFDSTYAYDVTSTGGLTFDLSQPPQPLLDDSITVSAASQDLNGIPAHFKLWVNDSLIGESWTKQSLASYAFALPDMLPIKNVTVEFDNDGFEEDGKDRNLKVQSIQVGGQLFYARMPNVRYDRGTIDGQRLIRTDQRNEADWAVDVLQKAGVPDSLLVSVAAPRTEYDKTFAVALAAKEWLIRQPDPMPLAVNVFSESAHARRSRLLYQKAFGAPMRVGVIATPKEGISADDWWEHRRATSFVLSQIAKYVYARLFFWPDTSAEGTN